MLPEEVEIPPTDFDGRSKVAMTTGKSKKQVSDSGPRQSRFKLARPWPNASIRTFDGASD